MKVYKKINNNVAFCRDANGHELIAIGRGIGFPATPYELNDLSKIDRTFYDVNFNQLEVLNDISEEIFDISIRILELAQKEIEANFNENLVFTLADHINFAIEREKKGIKIKNPLQFDIEYMYPKEMNIGYSAIRIIQKELGINFSRSEAANIAMHLINSEESYGESKRNDNCDVIEEITKIVEKDFDIKVDRKNFNYSRFVSHLEYLLKRKNAGDQISTENKALFNKVGNDFPQSLECVKHIRQYFAEKLNLFPNDEELLYLMLHINRLCSREDCNH